MTAAHRHCCYCVFWCCAVCSTQCLRVRHVVYTVIVVCRLLSDTSRDMQVRRLSGLDPGEARTMSESLEAVERQLQVGEGELHGAHKAKTRSSISEFNLKAGEKADRREEKEEALRAATTKGKKGTSALPLAPRAAPTPKASIVALKAKLEKALANFPDECAALGPRTSVDSDAGDDARRPCGGAGM